MIAPKTEQRFPSSAPHFSTQVFRLLAEKRFGPFYAFAGKTGILHGLSCIVHGGFIGDRAFQTPVPFVRIIGAVGQAIVAAGGKAGKCKRDQEEEMRRDFARPENQSPPLRCTRALPAGTSPKSNLGMHIMPKNSRCRMPLEPINR